MYIYIPTQSFYRIRCELFDTPNIIAIKSGNFPVATVARAREIYTFDTLLSLQFRSFGIMHTSRITAQLFPNCAFRCGSAAYLRAIIYACGPIELCALIRWPIIELSNHPRILINGFQNVKKDRGEKNPVRGLAFSIEIVAMRERGRAMRTRAADVLRYRRNCSLSRNNLAEKGVKRVGDFSSKSIIREGNCALE